MSNATYAYGKNPLKEALLSAARTGVSPIVSISVTKRALEDGELMGLIQKHKLTHTVVTKEEIESAVGRDAIHQGVLITLNERALYTSLEEVLSTVNKDTNPAFVLMDGLEDPHNVGAIIRSAVAFGASAIIMPEHHQAHINGTVIKAASGMNFAIPIVLIKNVNATLLSLKDKGFWTYALTGDGDTELHKAQFDTPTVVVIGSEGEGIAKKTLEHADFRLSIKTSELCESLNASNAVAVTLYEWKRQQTI
jgi:23S rRNA (guanosine2251-2'-O)-methyltransferase